MELADEQAAQRITALEDMILNMIPVLEAEADFHDTTGYVVTRDNLRGLCDSAAVLVHDGRKTMETIHKCEQNKARAVVENVKAWDTTDLKTIWQLLLESPPNHYDYDNTILSPINYCPYCGAKLETEGEE